MRHIGNLPSETQASAFEDYMLAAEMRVRADPEDGEWAIWVIEEDQIEEARAELLRFRQNPDDSRYNSHSAKAREIRRKEKQAAEQYKKNQIDVRTRWGKTSTGLSAGPVTKSLIWISVAIGLITGLGTTRDGLYPWLTFVDFQQLQVGQGTLTFGLEGILSGHVWRIITPMFIHYGMMHIVFNMMWVYQLASQIEARIGPARLVALIITTAAISNVGQFAWDRYSTPMGVTAFGGMSGVVCALFGYIWMKVRFEPQERYVLSQFTINFILIYLALCVMGVFGKNIANAAHLVGLSAGVAIGYWRTLAGRKPN
jgi:GlpG protein